MQLRTVYSKKLSQMLSEEGFELIKSEPNMVYPKFLVFFYEATEQLDNRIAEYKEKRGY